MYVYVYVYLFLFHFFVLNVLEKLYISTYSENVSRPLRKCKDSKSVQCLGMPSGHSETITVIMVLLYLNGYATALISFLFIGLIGSQRILSEMHNLSQVVAGVLIGTVYAVLYYIVGTPLYIFLISILVAIVFIVLTMVRVDREVQKPVPSWVDKELYPIIEKKRGHNMFVKIVHAVFPVFYMSMDQAMFMSWEELESKLDKIASMVKNDRIDAVVGLKSGGAILSNYLGKKMGIPFHYVKVSNKCVGYTVVDSWKDFLKRSKDFKVCEQIKEDLAGKKVLLVDEQIATGISITTAREYLLREKRAGSVKVATLIEWNKMPFDVIVPDDKKYVVFPWGYDN